MLSPRSPGLGMRMRMRAKVLFFLGVAGLAACADGPGDPSSGRVEADQPQSCRECHNLQFEEWQGSVMHYAAASPTFNAFERIVQEDTAGLVSSDGELASFCVRCHSPIGVDRQEIIGFNEGSNGAGAVASTVGQSAVSAEGLSCDFCHRVTGPDDEGSLLGDGIANASFLYEPGNSKLGPIERPAPSPVHQAEHNPYLSSAAFCGSCHDVRIPFPDAVTGEPFQRLENLFTEWQEGPYATADNPTGAPVTCQDCHMSLYPQAPPGTYPVTQVAQLPGAPERPHAIHAFTAVSTPLVEHERPLAEQFPDLAFPNLDTDAVDGFGYPLGQEQRRAAMLQAAVRMELTQAPLEVTADASRISVTLTLENVGAGHRVPAGFSQERQVWIELVISDEEGPLYSSGVLHDTAHPETGEVAPDGNLDDEDLEHGHFVYNSGLERSIFEPGPDADQRPEQNLGLVNFQNRFIFVDAAGRWHEVDDPLKANHMDNSRSLPMLEEKSFSYDAPVSRPVVGSVVVRARLRYRSFPPHFLRKLAVRAADLVDEELIDRNRVVDMAEVSALIPVTDPGPLAGTAADQLEVQEIDYDQPGADRSEFIELSNVGGAAADLHGISVQLVDGDTGLAYRTFNLRDAGSSLGVGQLLLIGPQVLTSAAPEIALVLEVPVAEDFIRNGPGCVRLLRDGEVIAGLTYEGPDLEDCGAGVMPSDDDAQVISLCRGEDESFTTCAPTPGW